MDKEEIQEVKKEAKKELIIEMIIDELFNSIIKSGKKLQVESYKISESKMTYLLKKYDEDKFKEYENMLLKDEEEGE